MQVLRLLAARRPRRAVSTITAAHPDSEPEEEDEGPFFDLDLASSSSHSSSGSDDELDFIISLHRSRSASPLQFFASEPSSRCKPGIGKTTNLRTLSFSISGANKKAAAFHGGRPSFASSARSLKLFMESPYRPADDEDASEPATKRGSGDVIRRYLTNISRRLRGGVRTRTAAGDTRGRHLRKSRSASAAVTLPAPPSRRDDSLIEKQDGIASAIAHCKESFHRASLSECDSSLLRSRSDPGKCEASAS